MKFEDYHFMSIGGYCLSLYALGENRIKGPVDNILYKNANALNDLLSYNYINILKGPNIKHSEHRYEFDNFKILHNSLTEKYIIEANNRLNTLKDFIKKIKTDSSYFLLFSIPHSFYQKGKFKEKEIAQIVNILKKFQLFDKTIFLGSTTDSKIEIPKNDWLWFSNKLDSNIVKKYSLKYIELTNINLFTDNGKKECHKQFIKNISTFLNQKKEKKNQNNTIHIYGNYFGL